MVKTVTGTRKIHVVRNVKGGVTRTRNLTCVCDYGMEGKGTECKNAVYVEKWRKVNLSGCGKKSSK